MNRVTLAFIFATSTVGTGTLGYFTNADHRLHFPEPAPVEERLSPEAAALYEVLDERHVTQVHIIPRGIRGLDADGGPAFDADGGVVVAPMTLAVYSVPSVTPGLPPVADEHESSTNSGAVPQIVALASEVIFPAALAKCPGLALPHYPPLSLAQVVRMGVEGDKATASILSHSLVVGVPPLPCEVDVEAPPEALTLVQQMTADLLVPAIREERGFR